MTFDFIDILHNRRLGGFLSTLFAPQIVFVRHITPAIFRPFWLEVSPLLSPFEPFPMFLGVLFFLFILLVDVTCVCALWSYLFIFFISILGFISWPGLVMSAFYFFGSICLLISVVLVFESFWSVIYCQIYVLYHDNCILQWSKQCATFLYGIQPRNCRIER